ncbi:MAG: hypothetical protein ACLPQS_01590 [Acidimicrobiales bacterium]|jgi:hypothetical protein
MAGMAFQFPSDAWFSELVERASADQSSMRRLGTADLRLGLEIRTGDGASQLFGLVLDGYDIDSNGLVTEAEFRPEVVISAPLGAWEELVTSIEANGAADSMHTLNSLAIIGEPFAVRSSDAMGNDKLFRYMGTLQAIFDAIGSSDAVVAVSGAPGVTG